MTCREVPPVSALESDFPGAVVSGLAARESWRKEVHRPATATHKWWAKRLGTVFRGIIVSAVADDADDAMRLYSGPTDLGDLTVLDPFGGSGTTLVEALKLGARAISVDINPVATLVQRQAVQEWDVDALRDGFAHVEASCRAEIDRVHRTDDGRTCLYYFWVAIGHCPECQDRVRLFDSPVFSRNAYPKRVPRAQIVCPTCLDVQEDRYDFVALRCRNGHPITPTGTVTGSRAVCTAGHTFKVMDSLGGRPPEFEMFAKMVLTPEGKRAYEAVTAFDRDLYAECAELLAALPDDAVLPQGKLASGNNTKQAIGWNFTAWSDFFNARQLYSLSLIATSISKLDVGAAEREALCALFSGTLEFNNMFCSFKGEGTGAVRHMFSHHILKPERTPLEAHPWGTPKSSGSFSTLMQSRLERAHRYKLRPTDLVPAPGGELTVEGLSKDLQCRVVENYADFSGDARAYVATRNATSLDLPDESVDLVITDPPYMDNVHYSELADFFHAWLVAMKPFDSYSSFDTTRTQGEVQQADPEEFGRAIEEVWRECARVLRPSGLMAFTFHQARITGWINLARSLQEAGLVVTAIQPVKGEMSTSITKSTAREPSNLDSIVVCRPAGGEHDRPQDMDAVVLLAERRLAALITQGVRVGAGDVRSVIRGSVLSHVVDQHEELDSWVDRVDDLADEVISRLIG